MLNPRKFDNIMLLKHWKLSQCDVIPTRLITWATPRPKSCSRTNTWPTCTFKPKPIKRPNNKEHAQKDPIGLHSGWPKPTWASHTLQWAKEDVKI